MHLASRFLNPYFVMDVIWWVGLWLLIMCFCVRLLFEFLCHLVHIFPFWNACWIAEHFLVFRPHFCIFQFLNHTSTSFFQFLCPCNPLAHFFNYLFLKFISTIISTGSHPNILSSPFALLLTLPLSPPASLPSSLSSSSSPAGVEAT